MGWEIRIYESSKSLGGDFKGMRFLSSTEKEIEFGTNLKIGGKFYRACACDPKEKVYAVEEVDFPFGFENKFEREFKCPYCGNVDHDAWELSEGSNEVECGACGTDLEYNKQIEINYSVKVKNPNVPLSI